MIDSWLEADRDAPRKQRQHARLTTSLLPRPLALTSGDQRARDRIRELTDRRRLLIPIEEVVQDVNRFLRGWVGYIRAFPRRRGDW